MAGESDGSGDVTCGRVSKDRFLGFRLDEDVCLGAGVLRVGIGIRTALASCEALVRATWEDSCVAPDVERVSEGAGEEATRCTDD